LEAVRSYQQAFTDLEQAVGEILWCTSYVVCAR
jgi:hypothetical protein